MRLVQHGPCELEFPLQGPLDTLKEQVVAGLENCYQAFGGNAAGGQVLDLDILSFDATPYLTQVPAPTGRLDVPTNAFGVLVHGNIQLKASEELAGIPVATSPCDVSFIYDYRASVDNGALQVVINGHNSSYAGGGQGHVGDPENVCTYLQELLETGGLNGQPPLLTQVALGQLQSAIQNVAQGPFLHIVNGVFTLDVSAIATLFGAVPADTTCHHAGTHPSCRGVEGSMLPLAVKGAQLFHPSLNQTQATAALIGTFEGGIDEPDLGAGNWACDALDHCNLRLPLSRVTGQPDAVDLVPFESFTDFTSPSLLAFFILEAFDNAQAPASLICTRTPVSSRPAGFYNRLYSTVHVRDASCGNKDEYGRWNHEPAQQNQSCKTDQDCCNLDPSYCDPQVLPLDVCRNGRCDFNNAYDCQNDAACFPWEKCTFVAREGAPKCIAIGSCDESDPFAKNVCPKIPFNGGTVATYCNGGECWRQ